MPVGSEGAKRTGGSGGSTRWRVRALIITLAIHHRNTGRRLPGTFSRLLFNDVEYCEYLRFANHFAAI